MGTKTILREGLYAVECDLTPLGVGRLRVALNVRADAGGLAEADAVAELLNRTADQEETARIVKERVDPVVDRMLVAWDWPDGEPCAGSRKAGFVEMYAVPLWHAARLIAHGETTDTITERHKRLRSAVVSVKALASLHGLY